MEMSGGKINATELVGAIISQADSLVEGSDTGTGKNQGFHDHSPADPGGHLCLPATASDVPRRSSDTRTVRYCVSFESFAYINLGYTDYKELGPGEIVRMNAGRRRDTQPGTQGNENLFFPVGLLRLSDLLPTRASTWRKCGTTAVVCLPNAIMSDAGSGSRRPGFRYRACSRLCQ